MRAEVDVGQLGEGLGGAGALDGELGVVVGEVVDVDAGHVADGLADPLDVLLAGAGVDDDEVVVVGELVDDDVVDEGAVGIEHGRVVGLADGELRGVVHAELLDGGERAGAAQLDVAHVGDVEEADGGADGSVLGDDAGVLDGHVPAAEVDHLGLVGAMGGVESGFTERGCCDFGHEGSLCGGVYRTLHDSTLGVRDRFTGCAERPERIYRFGEGWGRIAEGVAWRRYGRWECLPGWSWFD